MNARRVRGGTPTLDWIIEGSDGDVAPPKTFHTDPLSKRRQVESPSTSGDVSSRVILAFLGVAFVAGFVVPAIAWAGNLVVDRLVGLAGPIGITLLAGMLIVIGSKALKRRARV
jgi:hypothetical protein